MQPEPLTSETGNHGLDKALALGHVASDLHMFARWSSADTYMAEIRNAASHADFFVFNGDIFDFKWSTLGSSAATSEAAAEWFRTLCSDFRQCHFFYVLGNHDSHVNFQTTLTTLADEVDNFSWNDAYFRIGSALFMHGDLIFSGNGLSPFARLRFSKGEPRHSLFGSSYHVAIGMGAHSIASLLYAKRRCAKRILKVMQREEHPQMKGVSDIYIGHTHTSFSDFEYRGYAFHNSGSAVHDLHCNMMQINTGNAHDRR